MRSGINLKVEGTFGAGKHVSDIKLPVVEKLVAASVAERKRRHP